MYNNFPERILVALDGAAHGRCLDNLRPGSQDGQKLFHRRQRYGFILKSGTAS
jgi:hypothetical protein